MTHIRAMAVNASSVSFQSNNERRNRILILLPSLAAGGITRVMLDLAKGFQGSGYEVDFIPCRPFGAYENDLPASVRLIKLKPENSLSARLRVARLELGGLAQVARPALVALRPSFTQRYLADLTHYLNESKPDIVLSANTPTNLLAIWARRLAEVSPRIIVSEHTHLSLQSERTRRWKWRHIVPMVTRVYPDADAIVTVSEGVADDLAHIANLPRERIMTIYNPVVTSDLLKKANLLAPHPWLDDDGPPVIVAAGRFKPQKNFLLLIKAFARLRTQREARLLILGEGKCRTELEKLAKHMKVESDIAMPGFSGNPYAAFSRAAVFVLSSDYEGLGNVLIEAMACGCPVVATDCPSGPREILADGNYGPLVPVGDASALADGIAATLDRPIEASVLKQRADNFSIQASVDAYEALIESLLTQPSPSSRIARDAG